MGEQTAAMTGGTDSGDGEQTAGIAGTDSGDVVAQVWQTRREDYSVTSRGASHTLLMRRMLHANSERPAQVQWTHLQLLPN